MTKTTPGPNSTKRAIHHGQGLSVDFSFSGVKSKTNGRRKDYVGINSKTCQSKTSPIEWLRK